MLDLIQEALVNEKRHFQRVDGTMSDERRRAALKMFRDDTDCRILLATIGSAGVGYVKNALPFLYHPSENLPKSPE